MIFFRSAFCHTLRHCLSRPLASTAPGAILVAALLGCPVLTALGQPATPRQPAARAAADQDKLTIPAKERVALTSRDGVALAADFYPGGFQQFGDKVRRMDGKSVVPVILVHGIGGRGSDFETFALGLQSMGHAVLAPDLRGHGQSITRRTPAGMVQIDPERFRPQDLMTMIWDIEAAKRFLLDKNNEGLVNIELLAAVGAEFGALVTLNWAVHDWNRPQLPAYKQGRDVKVLVLLSPPAAYRGMSSRAATQHPMVGTRLPTLIAVGANDTTAVRDADRLFTLFERYHPMPDRSLKFIQADTSLQGVQLLQGRGLTVGIDVARFLHTHLVEQSIQFPWTLRQSPLSPATTTTD
jgi:pimeloyl-ACP methyl ester carboxylesterase